MSQYSNHLFTPGTENNSWAHLYNYIEEGNRVLDVGCSSGNFGEALIALKNCEVIGLDLDANDIKLASKKLSKAIEGDINNKSIYKKLGRYDVIIFADVLEHLIDPVSTLLNVKTLLKPGGKIAFSIPHMAHSSVRIDLLAGKFPYKERGLLDRTHLHFYDQTEFERIFRDSGYKISQVNPTVSEYPDDILQMKLQKANLQTNGNFKKFLKNTQGDIFQFVGFAIPASTKKIKSPPYIMPQDEVFKYAQDALEENTRLKNEVNNLKNRLQTIERAHVSGVSTAKTKKLFKLKYKKLWKKDRS